MEKKEENHKKRVIYLTSGFPGAGGVAFILAGRKNALV